MAKVSVDWDLCESNGICEAMAPDVFRLDDDDLLQVDDDTVSADNRDRVQRAVAGCPKSAISIVEE
jgi:ferredoxin